MNILESDELRMKLGGVYRITCIPNGRFYIGSTYHFQKRYGEHWQMAQSGTHNPIFQSSWNKYGWESFTFEIIEILEGREHLIAREQHYLDELRPWDSEVGFNVNRNATSTLGTKRTPEQVERMRFILKRPDIQEKMAANGRFVQSRDNAKLVAAASTQEVRSRAKENTDYKKSTAAMLAAKDKNLESLRRPETRAKMSASHKALWTPERRKAASDAALVRLSCGRQSAPCDPRSFPERRRCPAIP